MLNALPLHPTKRHPHTGQPLRAIFVRRDGRVFWPILGASEDDGGGEGEGGSGGNGGNGRVHATDAQGNDLGFPKDTPTAEMTDKEQAAYFKNTSRKHEGRVRDLLGDRTPEQVKADLEAYAELKKAEQTPAEQALAAARDEGKNEAIKTERSNTATAIFRGALEAGGVEGDDLDELVANFNVAGYVTDAGVDTTKITNFAKKLATKPGTGKQNNPDYGAGRRQGGTSGTAGGSVSAVINQRRSEREEKTRK